MDDLLSELQDAVSRVSCPYYRGVGICDQGCSTEPACQTDAPIVGWELRIAQIAIELTGNGR